MERHKAVFLDRDGTIIEDTGYIGDPRMVRFLSGALEALKEFQKNGYLMVIISNQSGIGRGWITEGQYAQVQRRMLEELERRQVTIAGSYYCTHAPDVRCSCRKPRPDLVVQAAQELHIDLSRSVMIGDKLSDIEAGLVAGCKTVLLQQADQRFSVTRVGKPENTVSSVLPDHTCTDWPSIREILFESVSQRFPAPSIS